MQSLIHYLKSVKGKLFVIFTISILVFVLAVGLISYQISSSVIQKRVASATQTTILQANKNMNMLFSGYEDLTLQIMINKELQSELEKVVGYGDNKSYESLMSLGKISEQINSYSFLNKSIQTVHLYLINGSSVNLSDDSKIEPAEIVKQDWFKQIVDRDGGAVWLDTKAGGYSGSSPSFAVGRAVKNSNNGKAVAVLLMEIKEDTMVKEFNEIQAGEQSHLYMTNSDNKIVHTGDIREIGTSAEVSLTPEHMEKDTDVFTTNNQMIVYAKSKLTGWFLVGATPVEALVKDAKKIFQATLYIAIIALIVAGVIGYFVARMIGTPIGKLRKLMQLGSEGDLTLRSRSMSKDEFGELSHSFDLMMDNIQALVQRTSISAKEVLQTAGELSHVSQTTATSAKEIAMATGEISTGATGLATESEKGNDMTMQVGTKVMDAVQASNDMQATALQIQNSSEQGTQYMSTLLDKTLETEARTRTMVEKVEQLKKSTGDIRKILEVLRSLTQQTNILSLNATIEAARAGSAGKGFMVVADEIRRLADQSNQSIAVVGTITEQIQKEIGETVDALSEAYPLYQDQVASVREADIIFGEVKQQMGGFETQLGAVSESFQELMQTQIVLTDVMSNVSAVAQQSSATSEEVSALASEQLYVSEGLVNLSDKLERLSSSLEESLSKFRT